MADLAETVTRTKRDAAETEHRPEPRPLIVGHRRRHVCRLPNQLAEHLVSKFQPLEALGDQTADDRAPGADATRMSHEPVKILRSKDPEITAKRPQIWQTILYREALGSRE